MTPEATSSDKPCWFVGASFGGNEDQTERFLTQGIWEIRTPKEKEAALVKSMKAGDKIAIKATFVRKKGLPFDNRDQPVSVMSIKAVGIILENLQDGERVKVQWTPLHPFREWYFYTYQATIWRILPGEWSTDNLIAFAFEGKPQDLKRFRNAPYWRERFGDDPKDQPRFAWTDFYEAIANGLLAFRDNRGSLIKELRGLSKKIDGLSHLSEDQYRDGSTGFLQDICPFTTMGLFNRGIKEATRKSVAKELAKILDVKVPVPDVFEGIPTLNNQNSWFFGFEKDRPENQIDSLWDVFGQGLSYADSKEADDAVIASFSHAFDEAMGLYGVGWTLTCGLYWARPWSFATLDQNSRIYLSQKLQVPLGKSGPKKRCSSEDYLRLMENLEGRFKEDDYPVHSYPDLSLQAWLYTPPVVEELPEDETEKTDSNQSQAGGAGTQPGKIPQIDSYTLSDIVKDGCFLELSELEPLIERLRDKKNIVLQGAPGTGKTWLAKRLAFALVGEKNEAKVRAVQFHPNLSYEDFVLGWRPGKDGKLELVDGIFLETISAAVKDPGSKFVVVIEEINRGNPAQVFGELLTLLEDGKRTPSAALELSYRDVNKIPRTVHVPENLYVIGTMNIADRSLALVDLALRRRFAFCDLEPRFGKRWHEWVTTKLNLDSDLARDIEHRLLQLNEKIGADPRLGKQFRIGQSYVTPTRPLDPGRTKSWFLQVVATEIGPLLQEYWFDAPNQAEEARKELLQGWS